MVDNLAIKLYGYLLAQPEAKRPAALNRTRGAAAGRLLGCLLP
jgi:hypothetical protein